MAEETQTEQSRAYFYRNFTYTRDHLVRDYLAELHNYHDDSREYSQRTARLSAPLAQCSPVALFWLLHHMDYLASQHINI